VDGKPYGHLIWGDGSYPMEDFVTCLNVNDYQGYLGQEITDAKYLENPAAADLKNMEHWNTFID
jgi:protein FrlC